MSTAPAMIQVTIDKATSEDAATLAVMATKINQETHYHRHVKADITAVLKTMEALIAHPDSFVLIARNGDEPVATIAALRHISPISGELGVGELFWWVTPSMREGMGFSSPGLLLLRRLEHWAKEQGAVWLQLTAPDERIESMYRALGYEQIETNYQKRL